MCIHAYIDICMHICLCGCTRKCIQCILYIELKYFVSNLNLKKGSVRPRKKAKNVS